MVILPHGYCHTKRSFIKLKIDWIFIVFTLLFYYCYSLSNMIVNICKTPNTFRKRNTCKFFTRIFAISYLLLYICYILYPAFMLNQGSLDSSCLMKNQAFENEIGNETRWKRLILSHSYLVLFDKIATLPFPVSYANWKFN